MITGCQVEWENSIFSLGHKTYITFGYLNTWVHIKFEAFVNKTQYHGYSQPLFIRAFHFTKILLMNAINWCKWIWSMYALTAVNGRFLNYTAGSIVSKCTKRIQITIKILLSKNMVKGKPHSHFDFIHLIVFHQPSKLVLIGIV